MRFIVDIVEGGGFWGSLFLGLFALMIAVTVILSIFDVILGAIFGGHPILERIGPIRAGSRYITPKPVPPAQQKTFNHPIKNGGAVIVSLQADGYWKLTLRDADQGVHETVLGPIRIKDAQTTFKKVCQFCGAGPLTKEKAEDGIYRIQKVLPPYPVKRKPDDPPAKASPPPQARKDNTNPIPTVPSPVAPEKLPEISPVKPKKTFQTKFDRNINRGGHLAISLQEDNTWHVISHDADGNAYEANLGELEPEDARAVFNRIPYLIGPINQTFGQKMVDWAKEFAERIPAERLRREERRQHLKQQMEARKQQWKERRQNR